MENWVCQRTDCQHNLWFVGVTKPRKRQGEFQSAKQLQVVITPKAQECHGCDCLVNDEWTLEEIGDIWSISRERVRQIQDNALRTLRKAQHPELALHHKEGLKEDSHLIGKMHGRWRQLDVIQTARRRYY